MNPTELIQDLLRDVPLGGGVVNASEGRLSWSPTTLRWDDNEGEELLWGPGDGGGSSVRLSRFATREAPSFIERLIRREARKHIWLHADIRLPGIHFALRARAPQDCSLLGFARLDTSDGQEVDFATLASLLKRWTTLHFPVASWQPDHAKAEAHVSSYYTILPTLRGNPSNEGLEALYTWFRGLERWERHAVISPVSRELRRWPAAYWTLSLDDLSTVRKQAHRALFARLEGSLGSFEPKAIEAAGLASLRELSLNGAREETLYAILSQPAFARLEVLELRGNRFTGRWADPMAAMQLLATTNALDSLRKLSLRGFDLTGHHVERLLNAAFAPRLTALDLRANALDDEAITHLIPTLAAWNLTTLDLRGNPLGTDAALELLTSRSLIALPELSFDWDHHDLQGRRSWRPHERPHLNLSDHGVDDAQLASLLASGAIARAQELDLSNNAITSEGAIALAHGNLHPELHYLDLRANPIDRAGQEALSTLTQRHFGLELLT